jgi:hypothetical protein
VRLLDGDTARLRGGAEARRLTVMRSTPSRNRVSTASDSAPSGSVMTRGNEPSKRSLMCTAASPCIRQRRLVLAGHGEQPRFRFTSSVPGSTPGAKA